LCVHGQIHHSNHGRKENLLFVFFGFSSGCVYGEKRWLFTMLSSLAAIIITLLYCICVYKEKGGAVVVDPPAATLRYSTLNNNNNNVDNNSGSVPVRSSLLLRQ